MDENQKEVIGDIATGAAGVGCCAASFLINCVISAIPVLIGIAIIGFLVKSCSESREITHYMIPPKETLSMTYLGKYREEVGGGYSTEELFQKLVSEMREKAPGLASVDDEDLREYLGYNEEIYNNSGAGAIVPNLKYFGRGALSLPTTAGMVVTGLGAIGADLVGADETAKRWRTNIRDISQGEEKLQSALGLAPSRAEMHRLSQPLYSSEGGFNWLKVGTSISESAPSIILGGAIGTAAAPVLARTPVFRALGRLATKSKWAKVNR